MFILKEFFFPSHSRGGLIRRHHPFQVESAHRPVMVFGELRGSTASGHTLSGPVFIFKNRTI